MEGETVLYRSGRKGPVKGSEGGTEAFEPDTGRDGTDYPRRKLRIMQYGYD